MVIAIDAIAGKPPNRALRVTVSRRRLGGKGMTNINVPSVNTEHGKQVFDPDVSGVSGYLNRLLKLGGEIDRHQVCLAEAIQATVRSDPDISFAVLKNGAGIVVT